MGLIEKLKNRQFKRDVRTKSDESLAKKYSVFTLVEKGIFKKYNDTMLFTDIMGEKVFNVHGDFLGYVWSETKEFLILLGESEYLETDINTSYALYDKNGKKLIPHGIYSNCYIANNYTVLSMPMLDKGKYRVSASNNWGGEIDMSLTQIDRASIYPEALIVTNQEVIATNYRSMMPLPIESYKEPLENNSLWIAQKTDEGKETVLRLDKNFHITETYELPFYSHEEKDLFYEDEKTKKVFKINVKNKERVNLKTGEVVNLVSLSRTRLLKKDRLKMQEELLASKEKEENSIIGLDNVVISISKDATIEE